MDYKQEIQKLYNMLDLNNRQKSLEFRNTLLEYISIINENLKHKDPAAKNKPQCPYCYSTHTKGHGKKANRARCLDCKKTFVKKQRSSLYYNKRNPDKIIDFIVLVHTTDKTKKEIVDELKISLTTYYQWKKEILLILPQLEEKFKKRSKTH